MGQEMFKILRHGFADPETPDIEREYCLGPVKGGAQKPTDVEPLGVHVTCAWFKPEVCFASDEKMEPALRILSIPSNSFVKICVVCNMDLVHNAQSVPRIIMQRVHQGLATEWSYIPCKRMGKADHTDGVLLRLSQAPNPDTVLIIQTPGGVISAKSLI